jgi:hypothetical protein
MSQKRGGVCGHGLGSDRPMMGALAAVRGCAAAAWSLTGARQGRRREKRECLWVWVHC